MKPTTRLRLIRLMLGYTVIGAGGFGLALILGLLPFGNLEPFTARTLGCFDLALAVIAGLGLWQPLKYAPILAVQLVFKLLWFAIVFFPLMLGGPVSNWLPMIGIAFGSFVVGDLIALPFLWLLQRRPMKE